MATFQLIDRVRAVAAADPGRVAYVKARDGGVLTYRALVDAVDAVGERVRTSIDRPGPVVLRCGNVGNFAVWLLGLLSTGRDAFPIHPDLAETEVDGLVARSGAAAVVDGASLRGVGVPPTLGDPEAWAGRPHHEERVMLGSLLLSSSGSTGVPKIVRRSTASLDAVAAAMVDAIGFTPADHVLAGVPLSHSYGLEHGLLAPLWAGATVHLCDGLDVPAMHAKLAGPVTIFPAVPPMIELLATLADAPASMPRLRTVYSAGGPLGPGVGERFAARSGRRVGQVYGMTEIGSVTYADPGRGDAGVGRPMAGVSVRVIDGEIAVRAASMFDGYLGDTADLVDGHFRTGDLGHVDAAGNLVVTGRTRLLIDVGGIKVNPLEVEAVLRQHPGVADCCVVPLRQSETIARLRAFVVPRHSDAPPDVPALRQFVRERLAPFKVPRVIEFREALPRSAAGKVLREVLAANADVSAGA